MGADNGTPGGMITGVFLAGSNAKRFELLKFELLKFELLKEVRAHAATIGF